MAFAIVVSALFVCSTAHLCVRLLAAAYDKRTERMFPTLNSKGPSQ